MAVVRGLGLLILPLLAAGSVFVWFERRDVPPAARLQHPPLPARYQNLKNPLRAPADAALQAFLNETGRAGLGREEALRHWLARQTEEGRLLYQKNCSHCHGVAGAGDGPMARGLRLRPANFTDRRTVAAVPEVYVFWRVKEGAAGLPPESTPWDSAMPPWGELLSDEEIWKVVLGVYDVAGVAPGK